MFREPSEKEKEDLVTFANKITPHSWNVIKDQNFCKNESGIFNVILDIMDGPTWAKAQDEEDTEFFGRVKEGLKYDSNGIAETKLEICPKMDTGVYKTIVHELSHIAVNRCQAWRLKAIKNNMETVDLGVEGETDHGPTFQKAFQILINRSKNLLSQADMEDLIKELNVYKEKP